MNTHVCIAVTPEQQQLSQAVAQFASRHAPVDATRAGLDDLATGRLPSWWTALVGNGFHAVHLPESVGGQGGGLEEMACVLEAAGSALLPGPLLTTAIAGAALASNPSPAAHTLLKEIAEGATAVMVSGEQAEVRGARDGDDWRLTGSSGLALGMCSAQRVVLPFTDEEAPCSGR